MWVVHEPWHRFPRVLVRLVLLGTMASTLEVLCYYARSPVELHPVSPHYVSLRLTLPARYHDIHRLRQRVLDPENLGGVVKSEEHTILWTPPSHLFPQQ